MARPDVTRILAKLQIDVTFHVFYEPQRARKLFSEVVASVWGASEAVPKKALAMKIEGFPS